MYVPIIDRERKRKCHSKIFFGDNFTKPVHNKWTNECEKNMEKCIWIFSWLRNNKILECIYTFRNPYRTHFSAYVGLGLGTL